MNWFNYYGLVIMAIIMVPNIIYAVKNKNNSNSGYNNKAVVILEQIGRYGCFVLMIFNIPYTYFNFWFDYGLIVYLSVNGGLCLLYLIFWAICWKRQDTLKALSLSVLPSCIFLFSGIVLANIPLIIFAVIFSVNHILISYKNRLV
jgi:membrane-associated HD superfamily phosphohydrolase